MQINIIITSVLNMKARIKENFIVNIVDINIKQVTRHYIKLYDKEKEIEVKLMIGR